ncbi:MAG: DegT/DnrJ/EryC1/StrS family aminotransferase, partial [Microcella sp.]|nr:DegT/DnrJ/EryC1/StrS family aminotransferase [Microcella sp.]
AVDVHLHTGAPDPKAVARAVQADTVGLVTTHLHGDAVDLAELDEWRASRGLWLIEDCAQAFGASGDGIPVGSTGDLATFSFYPTKPLGSVGDGGAIAARGARAPELLARVRELREYGWTTERFRLDLPGGRNSRLDALHAAVLSARLRFAAPAAARRRLIRRRYAEALASDRGATVLGNDSVQSAAHHAVVLAVTPAERDDLRSTLGTAGVGTSVHYPWLVSEMAGLDARVAEVGSPVAAERRARILSLPCDAALRDDEIDVVVLALERWSHG